MLTLTMPFCDRLCMFWQIHDGFEKKRFINVLKPDEVEQYYIDKVPLKRGCDYQDVLNMLLFYASPKASYCTGQSINVTGGQVMF